jgi:hypothetical protein
MLEVSNRLEQVEEEVKEETGHLEKARKGDEAEI